jgi:ornithine cyclodeaminase
MEGAAHQVLTSAEIRRLAPMPDAIDAVRAALRDLAAGAFDLPPRLVLGGGDVLVMSAHHRPSRTAVVKTVSVDLDRAPAITGTMVWTGRTRPLLADAAPVTQLRTGAIVGVATDALADPTSSRLALIGAGGQAADQVRAVHSVRPLEKLAVFDRHRACATALLSNLAAELPQVDLRVAPTIDHALDDAQIVCCATSSTTPLFSVDALPDNVHVNAIGSFRPSMRELPDKLMGTAVRVVVDQVAAATAEAGEVIHALRGGSVAMGDLVELADVLEAGPVTAGRTVFKTVGLAVQDWAIAALLGHRAKA